MREGWYRGAGGTILSRWRCSGLARAGLRAAEAAGAGPGLAVPSCPFLSLPVPTAQPVSRGRPLPKPAGFGAFAALWEDVGTVIRRYLGASHSCVGLPGTKRVRRRLWEPAEPLPHGYLHRAPGRWAGQERSKVPRGTLAAFAGKESPRRGRGNGSARPGLRFPHRPYGCPPPQPFSHFSFFSLSSFFFNLIFLMQRDWYFLSSFLLTAQLLGE